MYGKASGTLAGAALDGKQYAASASYTTGAITGTAFYTDDSAIGGTAAFGVGASYDLGGGGQGCRRRCQDQGGWPGRDVLRPRRVLHVLIPSPDHPERAGFGPAFRIGGFPSTRRYVSHAARKDGGSMALAEITARVRAAEAAAGRVREASR